MSLPEKRLGVAMLGARMHYAVPRIAQQHGVLQRFYTDSYVGNKPSLESLLRKMPERLQSKFVKQWLGRAAPDLDPNKVTSFERFGLSLAIKRKRASGAHALDALFSHTNEIFCRKCLRAGILEADAVFGFSSASLEIFEAAKAKGKTCILEQAILPRELEEKLLNELDAASSGAARETSVSLRAARERAEWALADYILVASDFVRNGLVECGVDAEKIVLIPYGVDKDSFAPTPRNHPGPSTPMNVLFVGKAGARKGAPALVEAARLLGPQKINVRFVGHVDLPKQLQKAAGEAVDFVGPVPRNEIRLHFDWAHVFVLPTIVEGSATVTYEALLSGLPVITTTNAGSIVKNGLSGQIIPIHAPEAIVSAIEKYRLDPDTWASHCEGAEAQRYEASLERYQEDLGNFLVKTLHRTQT